MRVAMLASVLVMLLAVGAEEAQPAPADAPLAAPADDKPAFEPAQFPEPRGLFIGQQWRYQQKVKFLPWLRDFALRVLADIVSIPTSVLRWTPLDYATFGVGVAVPVTMSIPIDGQSLDSRVQFAARKVMGGPNCDYAAETHNSQLCDNPPTKRPRVWTLPSDTAIISVVMATPVVMMLIAALPEGGEPFVEVGALALEALAVTQVYHVSLKLLTGREAPLARTGMGEYFGPTRISFPDGTPSGHAATLFAIAGVYATYFHTWWLQTLILGSAAVLSTFLMLDDTHFTSEVIVGAAMGYLVGRWVVEHRSSRYAYGANGLPVRLAAVSPVPVRGDGLAFAATFKF